MSTEPAFIFALDAVDRPRDPYYMTRWDRSMPVEVVASTKQEAIDKAKTMLGPAPDGLCWAFRVRSIRDVLVPAKEWA